MPISQSGIAIIRALWYDCEMKTHEYYFQKAAEQARLATCYRAKCGSVIVSKRGLIIGKGFNAPPLYDDKLRTCFVDWNLSIKPKFDKTCCIHAEWNAMIDAMKNHGNEIDGGALYFARVDENGELKVSSGKPHCTTCSRLALQTGLKTFGLWTGEPKIWNVRDYNNESYNYYAQKQK